MINHLTKFKRAVLIASVFSTALISGSSAFAENKPEIFTQEQKAEINKMFEEYLMKNGETILKSVEEFRTAEEAKSQQSAQENLKLYKDYFASKDLPSAGNPDGDITIVEFFDYNCGYCKRAFADLVKLMEEDKNIRVVFQEMPILSPVSKTMAEISHAAHLQGKYFDMHKALMAHNGGQSYEAFKAVAETIGLDMAKVETDTKSKETQDAIAKNMKTGQDLGIRGTPGFVIGDQIFPGYIGLDGLKDAVAKARAAKSGKTE